MCSCSKTFKQLQSSNRRQCAVQGLFNNVNDCYDVHVVMGYEHVSGTINTHLVLGVLHVRVAVSDANNNGSSNSEGLTGSTWEGRQR
jgi:hypothetical protein